MQYTINDIDPMPLPDVCWQPQNLYLHLLYVGYQREMMKYLEAYEKQTQNQRKEMMDKIMDEAQKQDKEDN